MLFDMFRQRGVLSFYNGTRSRFDVGDFSVFQFSVNSYLSGLYVTVCTMV